MAGVMDVRDVKEEKKIICARPAVGKWGVGQMEEERGEMRRKTYYICSIFEHHALTADGFVRLG